MFTGTQILIQGDARHLPLGSDSIGAIVTDAPYGLAFMGQGWDGSVPGVPFWLEALRVAKPGAFLLAFGGTRTWHRLAVAIEDAGWELRDTLMWLYGSGFPKSKNIGGGWGTALKPAHEPIIMARKPLSEGPVAANVERWGTGAINIDGSRIAGRWPANVLLDEEAALLLDHQSGEVKAGGNLRGTEPSRPFATCYGEMKGRRVWASYGDTGGASRFFYCAKASRQERNAGCDAFEPKPLNWSSGEQNPGSFQAEGTDRTARNYHPTVKPIDLMRYLIRLVTPKGGTVLDMFAGSGSTLCAAAVEGFNAIGIEREAEYVAIAQARIQWWRKHGHKTEQPRRRPARGTSELTLFAATAADEQRKGGA